MTEIVDLNRLKYYLSDRDHHCVVYNNKDWLIRCEYINRMVWYTCWYINVDYLIFEDCYDYSSTNIKDVFDYCNNCIEDSFIYYN